MFKIYETLLINLIDYLLVSAKRGYSDKLSLLIYRVVIYRFYYVFWGGQLACGIRYVCVRETYVILLNLLTSLDYAICFVYIKDESVQRWYHKNYLYQLQCTKGFPKG